MHVSISYLYVINLCISGRTRSDGAAGRPKASEISPSVITRTIVRLYPYNYNIHKYYRISYVSI